ncbi:Putative large exoprotein involved in heme utilization or adhesion of ShlA/HecA/FhaA family [Pectobacterium sp. F1-1]|uniref:hemagglutinin repeat-containing protein n=1 Tax=Pectobacterium sp. F1-1 TaxID=2949614 RepID=UPI0021D7BF3C|nr:hemagglutinin repeat-containing protein [Pectobacterium sp. F1-1]UYA60266.1 Putative large exoprotein involved in heme utilization or adhesion of ShlA/HecA/FhaA family [Pectobacterium sp. F1-1]
MKPVKTTQRLLAYTLIHLIAFQPLLPAMAAGVQVATGNTGLDQAGNGVPVINIATPNSAGISHNQYQDFNVGKPGLILNNGTEQLNPTQLGGLIQNNPNLKGKGADAIINEVVSGNRSTLAGYLEVGGKQASVIVANPNGITCDGCGFINTPQVTLTTGKPQLDAQGKLQHIDVQRGDITLTGQGLDASKSDYLSLIARTAQINAGLNANDTQIVLGASQVDASGKVTAQAADSGVKVALDTGALGGMYTNRIKLVSSDKGVGVNVGNLSARSGDITLSANGKLSLGDTVAQGNIQADADALALRGKQQAGDALTLNARQDITLQDATLRAGQDIALRSGGTLNAQNSLVSAGVDAQGTVRSAHQLSVKGDAVTLANTQLAAGKVTVNAGQSLQQDAKSGLKAESLLDMRGDTVSLAGSAGAENVRLEAKTLTSAGSAQLQAKDSATVRVTQQGDWQGNLAAGNTLSVEGGRLVQRGTLAGKTLALTLDTLDNQGDIAALQALTFSGGDITNSGTLAAAERLTANAQRLDNSGLLSARHDVKLELQTVLNNQGHILTDNQLFLLAGSLTNGGTLQAATLSAQANRLTNQGEVTANALDLTSQTTENHGTINARQMLALHGGSLVNRGTLSTGEKLALTLGESLDNRGRLQAGNTLQVTADRLSNAGTLTAPALQLHTGTLANQGTIQADNALQLDATRTLTQSATGTLLAGTDLTVNAGQAETEGAIQAQQFLLKAERWLNAGKTGITGDGQITATHLDNRGSLLTAGNWTIHGDVVSQAGVLQGNALNVQATTLTSSGQAQARGAVNLTVADTFTNSGDWLSGESLRLQAANTENRGTLQALTLTADGTSLDNRGTMSGINHLSLFLSGNLDNAGTLQGNQLSVETVQLTNQGSLHGTDALTLAIAGTLSSQGALLSEDDSTITAKRFDNQGRLQAKNVTLQVDELDNAGNIFGVSALALTATHGFTNRQAGKLLSQGLATLTAAEVANTGEWQAKALTLTANNLTNDGQIQGDEALSVTLPATDGKGTFVNRGTVTTGGDATLFARLMENQGTLSSLGNTVLTGTSLMNDGRVIAATGLSLRGDYQGRGLLNTAGTLTLDGDTLANNGHWESRALSLQGKQVTNQGTVLGNTVALAAERLTNHGTITGVETLTLSLGDSLNNTGALRSDSLSVAAVDVNNRGELQGTNHLQLNTTGWLDNAGLISASNTLTVTAGDVNQREKGTLEGKTVTLEAASLVNQGNILGVDALTLAIAGNITNRGNLLTQGNATVTAQSTDNSGLMQAASLLLDADEVTNAGQLLGIQALSVTAQHGLTNQQTGKLLTQGAAVLQAAQVENHGEWRADNLTLQSTHFINTGRVQAEGDIGITVAPASAARQGSFLPMALSLAADIQQLNASSSPQGREAGDGVLDNRGTLVSGGNTQLRATQLANQGSLASNGAATLIGGTVENAGTVLAVTSLSLTGNYQGSGTLQTDGLLDWSGTTLTNRGRWQANTIQLQGHALENQGTLLGQRTDITTNTLFNGGDIAGTDTLQLTVADSLTNAGNLYGKTLTLSATDLFNQGELSGDALHLTLQDAVRNSGLISGSQRVQLEAEQVDQQGSLESRQLQVQADALDNQGTLLGVDALTLAINTTARNSGKWLSQGDSTLTASRLENRGQWQANTLTLRADAVENAGQLLGLSALTLTANKTLTNAQTGTLLTEGLAVLKAVEAVNDGEWQADSLTLDAQHLTNAGHIQGDKSLTMTLANGDVTNQGTLWSTLATVAARTLTNDGTLTGVNGFQLTLDEALINQGTLNSTQLTAQADSLDNRGKINGLDRLELTTGNNLTNRGTLYGAAVTLNANDLTNSGAITGVDSLNLHLNGTLNNTRDLSSNALTIKANDVVNHGTLTGVNGLTLELGNHLDNQGALNSQALTIGANEVTNGGLLNGTRSLQLTLNDTLTNSGDLTGKNINVSATDVLNRGQILGADDLQLNVRNQLDNRGLISGSTTLGIAANHIDQQGTLEARKLKVNAGTLNNHGKMLGVDALTLAIAGTARNQGHWLSQGSSTLTAGEVDNNGQWQAGDITLQAADLTNRGQIFGINALSLMTLNTLNNQQGGKLLSQGIAVLRAATVTNDGDAQADRLTFYAQQLINRGRIQGDNGLAVTLERANPASLLTNQGTLLSGGDSWLSASQLDNQGTVSGVGKLTLDSGAVNNAGNVIADGALTLDGDYQGAGLLHSADTLTLRGNQLRNSGRWESRALTLNGGSFDNTGTVIGERGITLALRDGLTVGATGQLLTNGVLSAQAGTVTNDGVWQGNTLALTANALTNGGVLLGQDGLRLDLPGTYQGNAQSRLLSDGDAVITADRLSQSGEIAAGTLSLTTGTLDNGGRVLGSHGLTVTNRDELINRAGAELLTNGTGKLDSGTLSNAGTLQAGDLQLRAREMENQGRIQGTDALRLLDVLRYVGNKGSQLLSKGAATLQAKQADNAGLWQAGTLTLNGDTFSNSGTVAGLNSLSLNGDVLNNQGELFSQGSVTVVGQTLENGGTLTGVGGFTLDLTERVDNLAAGRLLSGGTGELTTGVLRNQGLWQSDDLRLIARDLEQQGNLLGVQRGTLQLTGAYQGAQSSQLVSGGELSLTANNLINRGQIQGSTLTLGAESLTNHGTLRGDRALNATVIGQFTNAPQARLSSDGTLSVQAAALNNQGDIKAANTTLMGSIIANGGTVQGTAALQLDATDRIINQQGGQLLSDGTTTLNAAVVDNHGWLQGRGLAVNTAQFTQQGSLMAQDKLTLKIPQWVNNGLVQAGELEIIADELDNHGTLLGLTQLALQTQRLINRQGAKLYSAQDLRLKTNELQQDGQLVALGNLTAELTGPLTFTQTMAAGKQLTLNVAGDLDQRGTLQGQSVQLASTGTLNNQGRILAGGGDSRISAKDIVQLEAGSVQAGGNLRLISDNTLNNKGLIGTTGDLLVQAGGLLHNSSMLYAGGNMRLLSDSLTNVFGTILAGNNLLIQRDAQGNASTSLLNSSGTIETQSGDITINTGTLTNQREGLVVTETELAGDSVPEWAGKTIANIPIGWFKPEDYGIYVSEEESGGGGHGAPRRWKSYAYLPFKNADIQKVVIEHKTIEIKSDNQSGIIRSGKDAFLYSNDLVNQSSILEAIKNINLQGERLNNLSYTSGSFIKALIYNHISFQENGEVARPSRYIDKHDRVMNRYMSYRLSGTPTYEKTVGESYNALIQAGGTITADVKQDISNTTLQPGSGGFMPASTKPVLDAITTLSPLQKQTSRQLASQDSSFNASAVDVTKAGNEQAALAGNAAGVNATGKAVTLAQQAGTALQAGAQADNITTAIAAPNTAGPLTLNTGDAVVLQSSTSSHVSNPDAVELTQQAGTALQAGAQAENISAVITAPTTSGPLTLNTGDAVVLAPSASGHVNNPDTVALTSTTQRPDAGNNLTPVNVNNTAAGITIAGTVGTPAVLTTPGMVAVDAPKPAASTDTLPGGSKPAAPQPLSAAALLSAIGNGLQNLSTNPLAEYPLPTGNNGLLVVDPNADSRYLIHTNPKLEQLGQVDNALFSDLQTLLGQQPSTVVPVETRSQWTQTDRVLGSSYLLDKLGLDADHDYRFLGDAEFDTRYISQAVLKQSGQRHLNGTGSDLAQMQMLLDNAAAAQKGMSLQLGVSLTPAQVANLSQSLVWWENIEVNGQTVLAPKLYLAQADKSNLQGSAIVANRVELNAGGSVTNSGTLKAVEVLAIASGDKIDNHESGLIKSDGGLNLVALNNITNSGSRIEGNTLQLASINGDIINHTASRDWQTTQPASLRDGIGSLVFTELGKTAEIVAGKSLTLSAGKDIRNVAATLNAGQDMALNAKGNVALEALTLKNNHFDIEWGRTDNINNSSTQHSLISADGVLKVVAGQDIQIDASRLSGGSAMSLTAGNDIRLIAQDTLKDTLSHTGSGIIQRRTQAVANSQLLSGGDLNLVAGRDVLSEAASLNAKGNATLAAGRDLNLLSETEETYSGNWWNRHADWQQNITRQSTELTTGNGLSLQAGRDINLQAAQGVASGAVTAQAGNNINLLSATETQHTFFEETQVKKKRFSKTVMHTLQETLQTNEKGSLLSGDSVTLAASQDINLQGSSVVGDKQVTLLANNDVNTAASVENYQHYEEHSKKKSGLFSGGGIGFTLGSTSTSQKLRDQAATQSQSISTLGSTTDSVTVKAGNDVTISGTDMVAGKDILLQGNNVTIDPGYDTRKQQQEFEQKSAGLTVALSGVVGSALNSAVQSIQAAKSESDGRLALLQGMKAGLAGYQAYQGSQSELNNKGQSSFVGVSVSLGAQNSRSSQTSEQKQSFGSTLNAAGDIGIESRTGDITVAGSQLKAGGDVLMNAAQDIHLLSARNSEDISGKNSSSGGNIGVSVGLSNGSAGLSIFANVNAAKGRETGTGNSWSETTVDAGNHVTLKSERDTRLTGAQVNGERIDVDAGRNLLLQSQQDSERYDSRQVSGSAGGSFTWGGGGGSGYISLSKDKIHSNYDSVQQQTGLFAGKDGFGIQTGEHTQLDAAVIGSTASAEKNRLDTGTLGWSGLDNKAEFKVEHSGAGFSASPSLNGSMLSTLAMNVPSALMSLGSRGNASSTTYAAVSDGTLLLRDTAKQVQDITTLSRDVEHANNALSPIFNKEKEQKRLKQAQLIGEIGAQMMDIVRTEGELKAQKAAEAKGDATVKRPQDGDSAQEWEVYKKALTESPTYKAEMQKYGTGSDFQRAAQAATAAIQALAGGDIQKAIASGASPYLAQLVKDVTLPKDESKITASDIAANAMAHAVVGAVVAQLSGQDAAAGAIGASSGELAARAIMAEQYPGKTANDLTEEEKQSVSALSTLAAGLISGLASNSTASAASGAQSGRNAVENNYLSDKDITTFTEKYANAKTDEERDQLKAELSQLDKDKQHQALSTGIPLKEQKAELEKLKLLAASPDCVGQCQELVSYSISQLEPVVNNPQLHQDNINKGILAAVISGIALERPIGGSSNASPLTREQQELIRKAESISTAKGIQNPFPRDLNEQVLWNGVKANPSAGYPLTGLNNDPKFPSSAGFQKMSVNHTLPDGRNIEVHYQYNSLTNKAYDMKVITPQRQGASFKEKQ